MVGEPASTSRVRSVPFVVEHKRCRRRQTRPAPRGARHARKRRDQLVGTMSGGKQQIQALLLGWSFTRGRGWCLIRRDVFQRGRRGWRPRFFAQWCVLSGPRPERTLAGFDLEAGPNPLLPSRLEKSCHSTKEANRPRLRRSAERSRGRRDKRKSGRQRRRGPI